MYFKENVLLDIADGPEGIEIYTSEDEGIIDCSNTFPAVYIVVTMYGAMSKFGPFTLKSIYEKLEKALNNKNGIISK